MNESEKTSAQRIRGFFRELFGQRYVKYLEQELIRQRLEYDGRIRGYIAEKLELVQKIERLELALIPQLRSPQASAMADKFRALESTTQMMAPSNWQQALEEHERLMQNEDEKESSK